MELLLIRHTSVDVPPGTCYGQTDVPLKPTFEAEASATKALLDSYGKIDAAFTSPLSRAVRLAEFCGYGDAKRDERLREMFFGRWEMMLYADIKGEEADRWYADYLHVATPGGEAFSDQVRRVGEFIEEIRRGPWQRVAAFAHGGVIASARVHTGLCEAQDTFRDLIPYGGIQCFTL